MQGILQGFRVAVSYTHLDVYKRQVFARKAVREYRIPFEISGDVPNAETVEAITVSYTHLDVYKRQRYIGGMLAFALISEVPFDIGFFSRYSICLLYTSRCV